MTEAKSIRGDVTQGEWPYWKPLVHLLGDELASWFMWMFEVEMEDGTAVQAYKHVFTRKYFHLGSDGRSFEFRSFGGEGPSGYEQVPFLRTAGMVLWLYDQERETLWKPGEREYCNCPLNCWD